LLIFSGFSTVGARQIAYDIRSNEHRKFTPTNSTGGAQSVGVNVCTPIGYFGPAGRRLPYARSHDQAEAVRQPALAG
jgi:hypothetical protein